jgi:hypothetical protein
MKVYNVKKSPKFPSGRATIYTKEEAEERGIAYIPNSNWRSCNYGDYVETDDGYITPIIARNGKDPCEYIKTPTGCFNPNRPGAIFDTEEFFQRNSYSRQSRWNGNSDKLTPQQEKFFEAFFKTFDIDYAIDVAYPKLDDLTKKTYKKQILISKLFKNAMAKVKDILEKAELTEPYLASKLKEWIDQGNPADRRYLVQMVAAGLKSDIVGSPQIKGERTRPLFSGVAEDAEYEDNTPKLLGAVKDGAISVTENK